MNEDDNQTPRRTSEQDITYTDPTFPSDPSSLVANPGYDVTTDYPPTMSGSSDPGKTYTYRPNAKPKTQNSVSSDGSMFRDQFTTPSTSGFCRGLNLFQCLTLILVGVLRFGELKTPGQLAGPPSTPVDFTQAPGRWQQLTTSSESGPVIQAAILATCSILMLLAVGAFGEMRQSGQMLPPPIPSHASSPQSGSVRSGSRQPRRRRSTASSSSGQSLERILSIASRLKPSNPPFSSQSPMGRQRNLSSSSRTRNAGPLQCAPVASPTLDTHNDMSAFGNLGAHFPASAPADYAIAYGDVSPSGHGEDQGMPDGHHTGGSGDTEMTSPFTGTRSQDVNNRSPGNESPAASGSSFQGRTTPISFVFPVDHSEVHITSAKRRSSGPWLVCASGDTTNRQEGSEAMRSILSKETAGYPFARQQDHEGPPLEDVNSHYQRLATLVQEQTLEDDGILVNHSWVATPEGWREGMILSVGKWSDTM